MYSPVIQGSTLYSYRQKVLPEACTNRVKRCRAEAMDITLIHAAVVAKANRPFVRNTDANACFRSLRIQKS